MPKISIVIPVYNVAPYLRECLDSVLAQQFADWEAICLDDGSTDGSAKILDAYAVKDSRIKAVHQPNMGVSAARNAALRIAEGEYVTFLDGDDKIDVDWLSTANKLIDETRVDIVRLWYRIKEERGETSDSMPRLHSKRALIKWGIKNYLDKGFSWLNFIRRELITENGISFPQMRVCEDNIFMLRCLEKAKIAAEVKFPGCYYRQRPDSAVAKRYTAEDFLRVWDEVRKLNVLRNLYGCVMMLKFLKKQLKWWRKSRRKAK